MLAGAQQMVAGQPYGLPYVIVSIVENAAQAGWLDVLDWVTDATAGAWGRCGCPGEARGVGGGNQKAPSVAVPTHIRVCRTKRQTHHGMKSWTCARACVYVAANSAGCCGRPSLLKES